MLTGDNIGSSFDIVSNGSGETLLKEVKDSIKELAKQTLEAKNFSAGECSQIVFDNIGEESLKLRNLLETAGIVQSSMGEVMSYYEKCIVESASIESA